MMQVSAMNEITIGYLHHTGESDKTGGYKVVQNVSCSVNIDGMEQQVDTIGCGISLPDTSMIITKDGQLTICKSLSDFIDVDEDSILKLIPYVSSSHRKMNIGQEDFIYQDANSLVSKKSCVDEICNLIDKIEETRYVI